MIKIIITALLLLGLNLSASQADSKLIQYEKACKKRHPRACYYIGTIYKRGGFGVERNIKKAKFFYAQACKMRHQGACDQYNLIREKREVIGPNKNNNNFSYTYTTEIYGG